MPFAIDTTNLTEWYSKIITLRLPQLTAEDVQIIAAAAAERALKYTQDHPYATAFAVIQIGLSPILGTGWVGTGILKIVGFGPLGPYAGSIAAWYQSTYLGGYIPADSIFAACQRVMTAKL